MSSFTSSSWAFFAPWLLAFLGFLPWLPSLASFHGFLPPLHILLILSRILIVRSLLSVTSPFYFSLFSSLFLLTCSLTSFFLHFSESRTLLLCYILFFLMCWIDRVLRSPRSGQDTAGNPTLYWRSATWNVHRCSWGSSLYRYRRWSNMLLFSVGGYMGVILIFYHRSFSL